jgi:subtilase family serine protease
MKIARQQLLGHVHDIVSKLKPVGSLVESTPIDLVIALPAQNVEERTALLRDIYDPLSPRFRQFLSLDQYTQKFDPTEASYQSLLDFAKANQLTVVSTAPPKFIHVTAPAAVINKVFHVTLQQYPHPTEDRHFYAPDADPEVTLETLGLQITGLDNFRTPRRAPNPLKSPGKVSGSPRQASGSGNNGLYTGGDFRAAYVPGVTLTGKGQAVGILELNGYVESDIRMYEQQNSIPNVPLQNVYLDGYTGGDPNEESAADIELVISMAPGLAQVTIYGVPYNNAGIIDILHEMANPTQGEPLPYQITTSYYFFYDKNVYDSLARLAVQGQALFVASGDYGSYNETTGSGDFPPGDHPLVTSVGGTELVTSGPGGAWVSETTASFSGGGYSPWGGDPQFAIPWWQAGMDYTVSKGSTTVRNAPDVSIVADGITIFSNGSWTSFAGTSAAAPLWAGFMALANEQAAASGRPRVGFANPALWDIGRGGNYPTCFHDITTGNNFNSTNPNLYSAVAGYDLCTGWGTPNGIALINALVGHVDHFYTTSADERDNAVKIYGYRFEGIACNVFTVPQTGTVPLHRLVKETHFYTISDAERDNAVSNLGYVSEGEACFVYSAPTGTVPLYRLVKVGHFYTTSLPERDNAIATFGFLPEDNACHVFNTPQAGTVPLYRLLKGNDYFYTTSVAERDNAFTTFGYQDEGIACSVFPSEQPGTVPLHRLVKDTHFYTTSDAERDNAIQNLGYISEGEACYVYPAPTGTAPLYRVVNTDHFYTTSLSERDQAIRIYGYKSEDIACHVFESSAQNTTPLFRLVTG